MTKNEELVQYLDQLAQFIPGGLAWYVKEKGRLYTPAKRPKGTRKKAYKMCFKNAYHLAVDNPELTYVEGYALNIIPVLHAWCVTKDGVVVDNTWLHPEDCGYYGIPFTLEKVHHFQYMTKMYGILGDPGAVSELLGELDNRPKAGKIQIPATSKE